MYIPNKSVQDRVVEALSGFSDKDACWHWPKSLQKTGYGQLSARENGKMELHYAHRVAYFLHNGPIPKKMHVCHKCDNPPCFNPHHLFLGTARDNALDSSRKGRNNRGKRFKVGDKHWTRANPEKLEDTMCGENHFAAKLTEEKVLMIRASQEKGVRLAERLGVTPTLISYVRNRKIWRHI